MGVEDIPNIATAISAAFSAIIVAKYGFKGSQVTQEVAAERVAMEERQGLIANYKDLVKSLREDLVASENSYVEERKKRLEAEDALARYKAAQELRMLRCEKRGNLCMREGAEFGARVTTERRLGDSSNPYEPKPGGGI
jgi:hypothetical protein